MKTCRSCGIVKPLTEYYQHRRMRDGRRNDCKTCCKAADAQRYADGKLPRGRLYNRVEDRAYALRAHYGLTVEQYNSMLLAQNGSCAVCGRTEETLAVDHDHNSGMVRGLLCRRCNVAIGLLGDDADRLRAAANYLERSLVGV